MPDKKPFSALGSCNLCGDNLFEKVADKLRDTDNPKVYRCLSCGHMQLLPRPIRTEEKQYYDEDRQEKAIRPEVNLDKLRANFKSDIRRRAEFISKKFSKEKAILDVGCGYGFFLEEMIQRSYSIKGIEISRERRNLAETIVNVPVLDINLSEPDTGNEQADIVTLFHVLEHIIDPVGFCRNIYKLLKSGGCFVVEVPNVDELMLDACAAYNKFYWIRAHLNYFSRRTLAEVLKKAGFKNTEIIYVQRYGVENLCHWLMTGAPQIEKPVFEIEKPYDWLESYYRKYLEETGRSDTLFAVAYT